jgi:hypothetical protein
MESKLIVTTGTSHKTGQVFNRCEGCRQIKEQEEELHEEKPMMLTGFNPKKKTVEEEDETGEQPLIPPHKY